MASLFVSDHGGFVIKLKNEPGDGVAARVIRVRLRRLDDGNGNVSYERLVRIAVDSMDFGEDSDFEEDADPTSAIDLSYSDEQGDLVTIRSSDELADAIEQYADHGLLLINASMHQHRKAYGKAKRQKSSSKPNRVPSIQPSPSPPPRSAVAHTQALEVAHRVMKSSPNPNRVPSIQPSPSPPPSLAAAHTQTLEVAQRMAKSGSSGTESTLRQVSSSSGTPASHSEKLSSASSPRKSMIVLNDEGHHSISMSLDGKVIAIGSPQSNANGYKSGCVRVYKSTQNGWVQRGNDIPGKLAYDNCGYSVSLSSDGAYLAVGSPIDRDIKDGMGHVRIFSLKSRHLTQIGDDISSRVVGDHFGSSVSLSSNGMVVAIGAVGCSHDGVRVYELRFMKWIQRGGKISSSSDSINTRTHVSLSSDGTTVAFGTVGHLFRGDLARLFKYDTEEKHDWIQVGTDFTGKGVCASLAQFGRLIAIGSPDSGIKRGSVHVYRIRSNRLLQVGQVIQGNSPGDMSGSLVSMSADGGTIAIAAKHNRAAKGSNGYIRVLRFYVARWILKMEVEVSIPSYFFSDPSLLMLSSDGSSMVFCPKVGNCIIYEVP